MGCKCGFCRKELLCPSSEILLFIDLDCFNLEVPLSFPSSALCVIDSFPLYSLGYRGIGHSWALFDCGTGISIAEYSFCWYNEKNLLSKICSCCLALYHI